MKSAISPKLKIFLVPSFRRCMANRSHLSNSQGDDNKEGAEPRNMDLPIEDPQHIKKHILPNDNVKQTYTNEDEDYNNDKGSDTETPEEGASTLLKDHSGGQDQSSS